MTRREIDSSFRTCSRGDKGERVREIQEWLCLHGIVLAIDGDFGPATEEGVRKFQSRENLTPSGRVDSKLYDRLIVPMTRALAPLAAESRSLAEMVVAYSEQHLASGPGEVGGANRGPWVRLYMDGHEGKSWPWCAGFVCFVLRQAAESCRLPMPLAPTFSCDQLAAEADRLGILLREADRRQTNRQLTAGTLFLVRKRDNDWVHTGIVTRVASDSFETIEGNTNERGEREGIEVCRRIRGYAGKDFIVLSR